jgi:hypothetical protein
MGLRMSEVDAAVSSPLKQGISECGNLTNLGHRPHSVQPTSPDFAPISAQVGKTFHHIFSGTIPNGGSV